MNHWKALAQAVRDRRIELGFRQIDIEAHGGPSYPTLRNIEQNKRTSYTRRTIKDLETAMLWPHGHVDLILKRGW